MQALLVAPGPNLNTSTLSKLYNDHDITIAINSALVACLSQNIVPTFWAILDNKEDWCKKGYKSHLESGRIHKLVALNRKSSYPDCPNLSFFDFRATNNPSEWSPDFINQTYITGASSTFSFALSYLIWSNYKEITIVGSTLIACQQNYFNSVSPLTIEEIQSKQYSYNLTKDNLKLWQDSNSLRNIKLIQL